MCLTELQRTEVSERAGTAAEKTGQIRWITDPFRFFVIIHSLSHPALCTLARPCITPSLLCSMFLLLHVIESD
jgi:hypothetical protein